MGDYDKRKSAGYSQQVAAEGQVSAATFPITPTGHQAVHSLWGGGFHSLCTVSVPTMPAPQLFISAP